MRAVAAYLVYLHHSDIQLSNQVLTRMFRETYIGVPIFFVLSGFLIYLRYANSCSVSKNWMANYFVNRYARIYPAYFFVVLVNFIIFHDAFSFLMQATFLRGFFDDYRFIGVAQGWTLTVEETFYCLFPFLVLLIRRIGFLISLLLIYIAGFILYLIGSRIHFHGFFTPSHFVIIYTFIGNAGEFFMGMYLAKIILHREAATGVATAKKSYITWCAFAGIFLYLYLAARWALYFDYPYVTSDLIGRAAYLFALPLCVTCLFYGLITEKSWLRSLLQNRVIVLLGKTSYIFYLIHLGSFYNVIVDKVTHNKFLVFVILNLLAILLYYMIEVPCRKLIRKLYHRRAVRLEFAI